MDFNIKSIAKNNCKSGYYGFILYGAALRVIKLNIYNISNGLSSRKELTRLGAVLISNNTNLLPDKWSLCLVPVQLLIL